MNPKTVTLRGEEIFSAGEYNGDQYDEADLDEMVKAFDALKGRLDPPVKLGHNDKQADAGKFQREDGKPAMGWVENLRRQGKKLICDLANVPAKIAELIQQGAYKKKSAEIYWNFKDGGKTYPRALKAVALLGADIPANRDIASLSALYDDEGREYRRAEYADERPKRGDDDKAAETDGASPAVATLEEVEQELSEFGERLSQATKGRVGAPAIRQFLSEIRAKMRSLMGGRKDQTEGQEGEHDHVEWSAAQINDLPDASFAIIRPGGTKDESGRTVPRALRMLPHHGPDVKSGADDDSVDLPHLRNALARLNQAEMSAGEKRAALAHLRAHAKAREVGASPGEMADIKNHIREVDKRMGELEELTKKYGELEASVATFAEKLSAADAKAAAAEAARGKAEADVKAYAEKLTAVETSLAAESKARRLSELRTVAAEFPHIPGTAQEKADKLQRAEGAGMYDERIAEWKALNAQIEAGGLFEQRAYTHDPGPESAKGRFDAEVRKLTEAGKTISEATAAVAESHPRLYSDYQLEHERRSRKGGER